MAKGITASEMGKRGAAVRARRYSREQIQQWGKMGGRPMKLDRRAIVRLRKLLGSGTSQAECARDLGVSTRTVGRIIARMERAREIGTRAEPFVRQGGPIKTDPLP